MGIPAQRGYPDAPPWFPVRPGDSSEPAPHMGIPYGYTSPKMRHGGPPHRRYAGGQASPRGYSGEGLTTRQSGAHSSPSNTLKPQVMRERKAGPGQGMLAGGLRAMRGGFATAGPMASISPQGGATVFGGANGSSASSMVQSKSQSVIKPGGDGITPGTEKGTIS
eukprot:666315-Amorphochlora_amoeboformis.AAC.1